MNSSLSCLSSLYLRVADNVAFIMPIKETGRLLAVTEMLLSPSEENINRLVA